MVDAAGGVTGRQDSDVDLSDLHGLIDDVRSGAVSPDDAVARLRRLPFADLDVARIDHHRALRQDAVEAVYGPGKTPEHCVTIIAELIAEPADGAVLLTRVDDEQAAAVLAAHPDGERHGDTIVWRPAAERSEKVVVVTAGTADLPVADECATVLIASGFRPRRVTDAGVAGIHRILAEVDELTDADAVVVVAGMEGALASVVGGIAGCPVVAVPTSVGYGAGLEGVTALLGMLASCAAGVTVVGIDNGFGAAMAVARALPRQRRRLRVAPAGAAAEEPAS
jgi:pyridinium-3,5-biscarboxylic acid mononucleotide synthase